jgi:hypothetical protein
MGRAAAKLRPAHPALASSHADQAMTIAGCRALADAV